MIGPRTRMILQRFLSAIPALAGVLVLIFLLLRVLPGDPAALFAASPSATAADVTELRQQLRLDRPLPEQLGLYLWDMTRGDFGRSLMTGRAVADDLWDRLPATLELVSLSFVVSLVTALALGITAALRPDSLIDHGVRILCTIWVTLPAFVTGLLLVFVFYYLAGWAPAPTGRLDLFAIVPPTVTGFILIDTLLVRDLETFVSAVSQLVLPILTLTIATVPPLARVTRASMISAMSSDFIRTARALGLPRRQIVLTYGLRNAILPVLTILGTTVAGLLGGSIVVEKVFAWPGISAYAMDALLSSDYAPVQGFVVLVCGVYLFVNLLIDILSGLSDPRVSLS
ncbi:ABC transporter permease [Rhizobium puerariae]|uniref:ABC transporter permease n=1 Tax=Rhizobium puerariae TaxID=1585791 RepID=A0ABV6AJD6_9HYPH